MNCKFVAAAAAAFLSMSSVANAGIIYFFEEKGSDVVGTLSGSVDLTGATQQAAGYTYGSIESLLSPISGFVIAANSPTTVDFYSIDARLPYGSGGFQNDLAGTRVGDAFALDGLNGAVVGLEAGYTSGSELSATWTITGQSFSSLGITEGSYSMFLTGVTGDNEIKLQFGGTAPGGGGANVVPLPAGLPMLLAGLGGLAMLRRRS